MSGEATKGSESIEWWESRQMGLGNVLSVGEGRIWKE